MDLRNLPPARTFAPLLLLALGAAACDQDKIVAPGQSFGRDFTSAVAAEADDDLLEDPFVGLLLGSLKDQTAADAIRVELGRLAAAEPTHRTPLGEALASNSTTGRETGADSEDIVAVAALRFLLDRAGAMTRPAPPSEGSRTRR